MKIRADVQGGLWVIAAAWPKAILITQEFINSAPGHCHLTWPHLSLRFENGHALYQVETCDRGAWRGQFLEGWLTAWNS